MKLTLELNTVYVDVTLTGINPLLVHRFREQDEQPKATRTQKTKAVKDTREEALLAANIGKDGVHYLSAFAISNAMTTTGGNHKQRSSRKSLRYLVPSAIRIDAPDTTIPILVKGKPAKNKDIVVDARPVVIPATKGRIMRYRPKYENWSMKFGMEVNTDLIDVDMAQQLLMEAGLQVGLGDFRPEKRGPFGTFRITQWSEVPAKSQGDGKKPRKKAPSKKTSSSRSEAAKKAAATRKKKSAA